MSEFTDHKLPVSADDDRVQRVEVRYANPMWPIAFMISALIVAMVVLAIFRPDLVTHL